MSGLSPRGADFTESHLGHNSIQSWFCPLSSLANPSLVGPASKSTFMGIGIHNLSAASGVETGATDLAAAVRQAASGLLGTTVQLADLVRILPLLTPAFPLCLRIWVALIHAVMRPGQTCTRSFHSWRAGSCTLALWRCYLRTLHFFRRASLLRSAGRVLRGRTYLCADHTCSLGTGCWRTARAASRPCGRCVRSFLVLNWPCWVFN